MTRSEDYETAVVPHSVQTDAADLAWSLEDTTPDAMPGDGRRPLSAVLLALLAVVAAGGVALGAFVVGQHEPERINAPRRASSSPPPPPPVASPSHAVPVPVATPAAKPAPPAPSTVRVAPPTITIEASPPVATEVPPPPPPPSAPQFDPVRDQWLLNNMRSLGYVIVNPQLVISNAHEACRLFQRGESSEQVNQQMSTRMGANMTDTLQLTSSAMLAYPNCY
jgi:hypothetical protein